MPHSAAIFDLDGVIIDSGPLHLQAWKNVLKRHGIITDDMEFRRLFGMRDSEVVPRLIANHSDDEVKQFVQEKSSMFQGLIEQHAQPIDGVVDFIDRLRAHDIGVALASLASPDEIAIMLKTVGLYDKMMIVVTGEHAMRDKPAPDIFLTAAYRMNVEPSDVVVFEDAVAGVEAARTAGAATIGVATSYTPGELSHADLVIQDFTDPKLYQFFQL